MKIKGKLETLDLKIGDILVKDAPILRTEDKNYLVRLKHHLKHPLFNDFVGKEVEISGEEDLKARQLAFENTTVFRVSQDPETQDPSIACCS